MKHIFVDKVSNKKRRHSENMSVTGCVILILLSQTVTQHFSSQRCFWVSKKPPAYSEKNSFWLTVHKGCLCITARIICSCYSNEVTHSTIWGGVEQKQVSCQLKKKKKIDFLNGVWLLWREQNYRTESHQKKWPQSKVRPWKYWKDTSYIKSYQWFVIIFKTLKDVMADTFDGLLMQKATQ